LKLQKYRYGDIFDDEYEVDVSLLATQVPKLILQPIVENALYHGVRVKGEKCVIRVRVAREGSDVIIEVYDSGVGMSKEKIAQILHPGVNERFGLIGTIERLRYFSGRDDVIEIESQIGEYTRVRLKLPDVGA
jgi:two-component system, sensor histidine kinase YesM